MLKLKLREGGSSHRCSHRSPIFEMVLLLRVICISHFSNGTALYPVLSSPLRPQTLADPSFFSLPTQATKIPQLTFCPLVFLPYLSTCAYTATAKRWGGKKRRGKKKRAYRNSRPNTTLTDAHPNATATSTIHHHSTMRRTNHRSRGLHPIPSMEAAA